VRLRLAITFAAALAILIAAFSVGVYALVRANLLGQLDARARQDLSIVESTLAENPEDAPEIEEHGLVERFTVQRGGAPLHTSAAWARSGIPLPASPGSDSIERRWRSEDGHAFLVLSGRIGSDQDSLECSVAEDEAPARSSLATLRLILALALPAATAAGFGAGWFLTGRFLSPVRVMAQAAGRINEQRLSERLPVESASDEFGSLAVVVNEMLARIEDAFERLRRFTSDASHELRTPLTALRTVGEGALGAPLSSQRYRQTIASMLEEADRMTALVEDLLLLAREDSGTYRSTFETVDLGRLAGDVAETLRPVSDERGQVLACQVEPDVIVRGDPTILRQAIVNLVDNAIRYTPPGGSIDLRVRADDGAAEVLVRDSGPGIAPEHREKVFERFYRVDRGRSRSTGGAGLGLPIARWAVELHGGRVGLESEVGQGSMFRIRIPRAT